MKAGVFTSVIVVINKLQTKLDVIDVTIPSGCNIKKRKHKKLEKYQRLIGLIVQVVIGELGVIANHQTRRVTSADLKNNLRDLCLEKIKYFDGGGSGFNPGNI